jgi:hypothetical protein
MTGMNKNDQTFNICDTQFEIKHFPVLYERHRYDAEWLDKQVQSIATAWHEGNIASAVVALESDLVHDLS